jgi:putative ABC transport system permease protein
MILNYIKIAFRNIARHKVYSIINILGLAIGMACAIMLLLLVRDQTSYDTHSSKYNRIYMVHSHYRFQGEDQYNIGSSFPLAGALKDEYPAIEESVRTGIYDKFYFFDQKREPIGEDSVCYADPAIFKVFDHEFIYGSTEGALDDPKSIVLSETLAKKYFGEQNPVGKSLSRTNGVDYIVKGVFKDLPRQSFRHYTALIPMMDLAEKIDRETLNSRRSSDFFYIWGQNYTYILLNENTKIESITGDYKRFREKYIAEFAKQSDEDFEPIFQPLADVYLHHTMPPGSFQRSIFDMYALSTLALLILIISCINYMNLATAISTGRSREVGVRKVLGADRGSLIGQFLCESMIITIVALFIALGLIELLLPGYNNLLGINESLISFSVFGSPAVFLGLIVFILIVGLLSGSYPAFVLSSFLPVSVIRGGLRSRKGRGALRKVLVIVQFMISIIIIFITLAYQEQINYVQRMDLGFNKNDVLVITPSGLESKGSISTFKKELLNNSGISAVATSNTTAGINSNWQSIFKIEDSRGAFLNKTFSYAMADYDFIDLMGMKVLEGRSFSREMGTDPTEAFLVNDTLVKEMGWTDSPVGKHVQIQWAGRDGMVIGVLKDFYFLSLHQKLSPMIIMLNENAPTDLINVVSIKIRPENSAKTIEFIKKKWLEQNPTQPFEYKFLEGIISNQYLSEERGGRLINYSAILTILISCLGLFSLSSFEVGKRTKEIGVRKVYGASIWNILFFLSRNFIKLVVISCIIAYPLLVAMGKTLPRTYYYNPPDDPWLFIQVVSMILLIALATVSYHAIKAALTDPVKALRYE